MKSDDPLWEEDGLLQAVDNVFNTYNLDCNDFLCNYYADSNFVPYLIQENIIKFIDKRHKYH